MFIFKVIKDTSDYKKTVITIFSSNNPELINEGSETSPSKRILSLCSSYDKVDDGILILKEIGIENIRNECPHFNEWLSVLETLGSTSRSC